MAIVVAIIDDIMELGPMNLCLDEPHAAAVGFIRIYTTGCG